MWWIGIVVIIGILLFLAKTIIKRIPYSEYWIVDHRGTPIVKCPGYCIIIPLFGYDKIIQKVTAHRQYHIPLFPERDEIWIDLFKGGEIRLYDPRIWIIVNDPLKAVTTAKNFEEQLREMVESRLTGALNVLTYEDIVELRVPKVMTGVEKRAVKIKIKKKIDEIIQESKGVQDFLKTIDAGYRGFTLDDFDFDEGTTKKRRDRILTEMGKEIARNISEGRKNEILAIAKIAKELKKAGFTEKNAQKIASERYQDHLVGEKGKLQKIIWQGGLSISEIAAQWEMGKGILLGEANSSEEKKKESEEARGEKIIEEARKTAKKLKE
jgi:hypothetical protein